MEAELFRQGHPETVRKLNLLVDAVNKLERMTGDGIIKVLRTPDGVVLSANMDAIQEKIPQRPTIVGLRKAYMKTNATSGTTDTVYLDTDATGDEVTCNFAISGGTNLNAAVPRLADGDKVFVAYVNGAWWCLSNFQASIDCVCEAP